MCDRVLNTPLVLVSMSEKLSDFVSDFDLIGSFYHVTYAFRLNLHSLIVCKCQVTLWPEQAWYLKFKWLQPFRSVWLNGWVFVNELNGCRFEFCYSTHLTPLKTSGNQRFLFSEIGIKGTLSRNGLSVD